MTQIVGARKRDGHDDTSHWDSRMTLVSTSDPPKIYGDRVFSAATPRL